MLPQPEADTDLIAHYYKLSPVISSLTDYVQLPDGAESVLNALMDLKRAEYMNDAKSIGALVGKANFALKNIETYYNQKSATSNPQMHGAFYNTGFPADI